ncbi:MAG: pilus assembly protein, partial [Chloroflexi bacterium]|nr:pilus assembly protein [Chloroflexota bacterium]
MRPARTRMAGLLLTARRGQAIVWTAVMLPLFLSVVGLAIDGGIVFSARRELQNVADSAARAGAQQIDVQGYRESRGRTVVLDTAAAGDIAARYAGDQRLGADVEIEVGLRRVQVTVSRDVPTSFVRAVGVSTV